MGNYKEDNINCSVYRHRRLDNNEIFYIGIASTKRRAHTKVGRNKWWNNIVNKTEYEVEIVATELSWDSACELEQFLIKEYGRRDLNLGNLVNLTNGGEGAYNRIVSKETREKIGKKSLGRIPSEETKNKMSISAIGRIVIKETREKISKKSFGRVNSEETRKKISLANKGKVVKDSTKKKQGILHQKKVINKKTLEIFDSVKICCELNNESKFKLYKMLIGERINKTDFIYLDEYNKLIKK
jgi:hypothetical protein